jgi:hypothetical protein
MARQQDEHGVIGSWDWRVLEGNCEVYGILR